MAKDARSNNDPPAASRVPFRARALRRLTAFPRWVRANPLRGSLVLGITVAMIGLAVGLTFAFRAPARPAYLRRLAQAFARFDAGDTREARHLAAELLADPDVGYQDKGGPYYILGAITIREADEQINPAKRQLLYLVASRYLDEARNRDVPQTRGQEGLLLLGRALFAAGRFARSISILHEALQANPGRGPQIHVLLADACLNLKPPRLAEALEHNRLYLATAGLSPRELDVGRLTASRILLAQRNYAAAADAADAIQQSSPLYPEAVVQQGFVLVESLRQAASEPPADAAARIDALIGRLRRLLALEGLPPSVAAEAQLLIGLGLQQQRDIPAAKAQLDRTRRDFFGQPEGLAAMVFLADLVLPSDPLEAVALYKRAMLQAGPADAYENRWLPAEQLQKRLETAIDDLTNGEQFAAALELAGALVPHFPRIVALARQAEIHRAWARRLEVQAGRQRLPQADVTAAEARQQWRQAGADNRLLADLRIATRFYLDDLARAADDFRRGQGYQQAVTVYRDLLHQDPPQGQAEALAGLGESLLALGQTDAALVALADCRDSYPKHPMTYRARLLASRALQEQGKLAEAKQMLIDNLYRYSLAPQSGEWRDSLFALGTMLYREALDLESRSRLGGVDRPDPDLRRAGLAILEQSHAAFDEAIRTLDEAVQRYPTAPQAALARYRIAEAHRHSAKWPRKRLATVTIETSRASLTRQMQEQLQSAVNEYNVLITRLSEQPDASRGATEAAILRNCYFGRADALFDLGRYDEAIEAYSAATNRYQHDPESLEAYVQIASCYRRQDRVGEARGTLEQARVVLQRIRPDADFKRTTRLARQDWLALLEWLRTL